MEYNARGTVEGVPVVPMTAMPHHLQPWHTTLPLPGPFLQWQTYTHTGRKNTNQTSPHPPSHPPMASLSLLHPPTSTFYFFSPKHLASPFPLPTATLLSPHLNLNLTFLHPTAFISCATPRPLVTELAGDEREEFSVRFSFCKRALLI